MVKREGAAGHYPCVATDLDRTRTAADPLGLTLGRYLLTGDPFSAEEAERMGLVNEVVDTGRSLERATQFATHLASLSPAAIQGTKRALNRWMKQSFGPIFEHALSLEFMRFPKDTRYGSGFTVEK